MARNGGLMDSSIPSQLDEADLAAEIEIELPGSLDDGRVQMMMDATGVGEIEITPMDDGLRLTLSRLTSVARTRIFTPIWRRRCRSGS
jgi:hypothetical protein